ncbi:MAG TPA: RNA 2',3'-cyclic phosphodiesterase [Candidatus Kapabacteria bacterium]|nr:RNA 2',3'-cyclic phosphodiesterase [Candidatus Kapabacteria bacterium]
MNFGEAGMDGGSRKIRAFLAVKTPPEWDEKLADLQRNLKSKFGSGAFRWVKPDQIHITLRFFGWLKIEEAEDLKQKLPPILKVHPPFALTCVGLGCFPNARRPRVFWAGLQGDLEMAGALQRKILAATDGYGEPPEERPFKPHLTLARLKEPDRRHVTDLEEAISRGFQIDQPWKVTTVLLMESHLSPKGSTYEVVAKFELGN